MNAHEVIHADVVLMASHMADHHYTAREIAYIVEKPWKHRDILDAAKDEAAALRDATRDAA